MTERSAEQAPVQTRPDTHDTAADTARIPLAERLQRRISAASDERRNGGPGPAPAPPLGRTRRAPQRRLRARAAAAAGRAGPAECPADCTPCGADTHQQRPCRV